MDDLQTPAGVCAQCGAPLTGGRFCTNCGARIETLPESDQGWPSSTDTAERRYDVSGPPRHVAPTSPGAPPPVRPAHAAAPPTVTSSTGRVLPPPPPQPPPAPPSYDRQGPGMGLWIGVAAALVVVLLLGGFLLFHGSGGASPSSGASHPLVPKSHPTKATPSSESPSASPTSPSPSPAGPAGNVAGQAQVSAPAHAPDGVDFLGRPVTYVASNVVDGRLDTCWRQPGDATGTELTFHLDHPTQLTRVGLVNGYAKIAYDRGQRFDWYTGNRRVLGVDWIFDDGSQVSQHFGNSRTMQQMPIKPVTTSVVRLRITAVSPPGNGPASRNDTAISEVMLVGRAA